MRRVFDERGRCNTGYDDDGGGQEKESRKLRVNNLLVPKPASWRLLQTRKCSLVGTASLDEHGKN